VNLKKTHGVFLSSNRNWSRKIETGYTA